MNNIPFLYQTTFDKVNPSEIFTETRFKNLPPKMGYIKMEKNESDMNAVSLRTGTPMKFSGHEMVFVYSQE